MRTRVMSAAAAPILLAALLAGCSDNSSELQRVVCEVQLVNAGAPLLSAYVIDGGDGVIGPNGTNPPDDIYASDVVSVLFNARPYSSSVTSIGEEDVYGSYIITGYNLTWVPGANVPAGLDLSQFNLVNAPFYLQVPIRDEALGSVMIADRTLKDAIANALGLPWGFGQDFSATARLQFIGHDSGSQHESVIESGLYVSFTYAVSKN